MKDAGHGFGSQELDNLVHSFLDKHLRGIDVEIKDATLTSSPPRKN
jgi:hypothetical protein